MENVAKLLRFLTDRRNELRDVIESVRGFFSPAFFYRLDKFGSHPQSPLRMAARIENGSVFEITYNDNGRVRLAPNFDKLRVDS